MVIIAYTDDQISDLKRFCTASTPYHLRGVDRTFNSGPGYVTLMVFKNMVLIRNTSRDNPFFIGPTMFHNDAKQTCTGCSLTWYVTPSPTTCCARWRRWRRARLGRREGARLSVSWTRVLQPASAEHAALLGGRYRRSCHRPESGIQALLQRGSRI